MKKTIAALLCLVLLLGLAACTGKSETKKAESENTVPTGTAEDKTAGQPETDKPDETAKSDEKSEETAKPETSAKAESTPSPSPEPDGSIRIGVIMPSDGDEEQLLLDGVRLAMDQANRTGAGEQDFRLCIYHAETELKAAKTDKDIETVYSQLIVLAESDGVTALLLPSLPAAAVPAAESSDIPAVTVEGVSDKLFSVLSGDAQLGRDMADFTFDMLGMPKTAAVFDEAHAALAEGFAAQAEKRSLNVCFTKSLTAEDALPETAKAALETEPKAMFIACSEEQTAELVREAREQGFTGKIVVLGCETNEEILAQGGVISLVDYSPDDTAKANESFIAAFMSHYDAQPSAGAALAYDGAKLITNAILKAAQTAKIDGTAGSRDAVQKALLETEYGGVSGKIAFKLSPVPEREHVYLSITDGAAKFYTRY